MMIYSVKFSQLSYVQKIFIWCDFDRASSL